MRLIRNLAVFCVTLLGACSTTISEKGPVTLTSKAKYLPEFEKEYRSLYGLEDGFRPDLLTMHYPEEGPTFLSALSEHAASADAALVAVFSNNSVAESKNALYSTIFKYGATAFYSAIPELPEQGQYRLRSNFAVNLDAMQRRNPTSNLTYSKLLLYRLNPAP